MLDIDKRALADALRTRLAETLQSVTDSQRASQRGATHEESRAESEKDTRATEASYLARGLAERVQQLRGEVAALDALEIRHFEADEDVALTALVELIDEDGTSTLVWLVPAGGGEKLDAGGRTVRCATPTSPLGGSLVGRETGDELVLALPGGRRRVAIEAIG